MAMTRAELDKIFTDAIAMEFADIPTDESSIEYTFSDEFIKKMDKLLQRQQKISWNLLNTAKKRVAVIAIVFLALMTTACSIDVVRETILRKIVEIYEEYKHYFYEGETTKEIKYEYQLTKVPEGFELIDKVIDEQFVVTTYQNEMGDVIELQQDTTENMEYSVDLENGSLYTAKIADMQVEIYEHKEVKWIMWEIDGYRMMLAYHGVCEIEFLKEIVEEIK